MGLIENLARELNADILQTHISWVLIPERRKFVLKIKKPVNFGFLDFTTLEKRKEYCEREVELNRRLCSWIYEGVVPISKLENRYVVENDSNVVEYAVKMKYILPESLLINRLEETTGEDMKQIAERVAEFHSKAEEKPEFGRIEVIKYNTDENFEQTKPFVGKTISPETYRKIKEKTDRFYKDYASLFEKRIKEGKIRDGHGDIRPEHIALLPEGICIFDCIEFNERFRFGDVINDMCFLSTELDFLGYSELAKTYEETYKMLTREIDGEFYPLLNFYKAYRAYVRGKINSFISADESISPEEKKRAAENAKRYFNLAHYYLRMT